MAWLGIVVAAAVCLQSGMPRPCPVKKKVDTSLSQLNLGAAELQVVNGRQGGAVQMLQVRKNLSEQAFAVIQPGARFTVQGYMGMNWAARAGEPPHTLLHQAQLSSPKSVQIIQDCDLSEYTRSELAGPFHMHWTGADAAFVQDDAAAAQDQAWMDELVEQDTLHADGDGDSGKQAPTETTLHVDTQGQATHEQGPRGIKVADSKSEPWLRAGQANAGSRHDANVEVALHADRICSAREARGQLEQAMDWPPLPVPWPEAPESAAPCPELSSITAQVPLSVGDRGYDQTRRVRVAQQLPCHACNATGHAARAVHTCARCSGQGMWRRTSSMPSSVIHTAAHSLRADTTRGMPALLAQHAMPCPVCHGWGHHPDVTHAAGSCPVCGGQRVLRQQTDVIITVPAGARPGWRAEKLMLAGVGPLEAPGYLHASATMDWWCLTAVEPALPREVYALAHWTEWSAGLEHRELMQNQLQHAGVPWEQRTFLQADNDTQWYGKLLDSPELPASLLAQLYERGHITLSDDPVPAWFHAMVATSRAQPMLRIAARNASADLPLGSLELGTAPSDLHARLSIGQAFAHSMPALRAAVNAWYTGGTITNSVDGVGFTRCVSSPDLGGTGPLRHCSPPVGDRVVAVPTAANASQAARALQQMPVPGSQVATVLTQAAWQALQASPAPLGAPPGPAAVWDTIQSQGGLGPGWMNISVSYEGASSLVMPVSLLESGTGWSRTVALPDGRVLQLAVRGQTTQGSILHVPGGGLPVLGAALGAVVNATAGLAGAMPAPPAPVSRVLSNAACLIRLLVLSEACRPALRLPQLVESGLAWLQAHGKLVPEFRAGSIAWPALARTQMGRGLYALSSCVPPASYVELLRKAAPVLRSAGSSALGVANVSARLPIAHNFWRTELGSTCAVTCNVSAPHLAALQRQQPAIQDMVDAARACHPQAARCFLLAVLQTTRTSSCDTQPQHSGPIDAADTTVSQQVHWPAGATAPATLQLSDAWVESRFAAASTAWRQHARAITRRSAATLAFAHDALAAVAASTSSKRQRLRASIARYALSAARPALLSTLSMACQSSVAACTACARCMDTTAQASCAECTTSLRSFIDGMPQHAVPPMQWLTTDEYARAWHPLHIHMQVQLPASLPDGLRDVVRQAFSAG